MNLINCCRSLEKKLVEPRYWLVPVTWAICILGYASYFGEKYISDTYLCLLIGKHLFSGLGYTTPAIRDFYSPASSAYLARSYPPVVPIMFGLVDKLFSTGIASALIVNLGMLYGIIHGWFFLSRRIIPSRLWQIVFLGIVFLTISDLPFMDEVVAGKSIPTTLLLLLGVLYVTYTDQFSDKRCLSIGMLLGLIYLTRFDSSFFVLVYPLWIGRLKELRWKTVGIIYVGLFAVILPWIIRNIVAFGQMFSTDSSSAVTSLYYLDALCFFKDGPPRIMSNLTLWTDERLMWGFSNLQKLYYYFSPPGMVVLFLFGLGFFLFRQDKQKRFLFHTAILWTVINVVTVSLPLNDTLRYFAISAMLIWYCSLLTCIRLAHKMFPTAASVTIPEKIDFLPNAFFSLLVIIVVAINYHAKFEGDVKAPLYKTLAHDFSPYIHSGDWVAYGEVQPLAYYSGWNTIMLPYNFSKPKPDKVSGYNADDWKALFLPPFMTVPDGDFIAWRDKFHVRYIIVDRQADLVQYSSLPPIGYSGNNVLLDARGF